MKNIYALGTDTEVQRFSDHEVHLSATHMEEDRRACTLRAFLTAMRTPGFSLGACTMLPQRKIEDMVFRIICSVRCMDILRRGKYAVVNNTSRAQSTVVYDGMDRTSMELGPCEIRWFDL